MSALRRALRTSAAGAAGLALLSTAVSIAFSRHAARVVFNRARPPGVCALLRLLRVTRPLSIIFRVLTAPLRCYPDVYVLGEVRCGTTSLASLLRDRLRMVGPFTPWVHPLADSKESFYFVGHYWGLVAPALYRLCFPLQLRRWAHRLLHRRRLLVFDGCASYLSAPWLPPLLRRVSPKPVLIVCLREPVSQHTSWWALERGAMAWGDAMGLADEYLPPPARIGGYPPPSLAEAVRLARSSAVAERWAAAEELASADAASGLAGGTTLPDWAAPFPNGQLCAFDAMGRYADTLDRWLRFFPRENFVFVELDELSARPEAVLQRIAAACDRILSPDAAGGAVPTAPSAAAAAEPAPRLNGSSPLPPSLEPDEATLRELAEYYRPHNERLFRLLGRDLGWHDDPRYWWYARAAGSERR